MYEAIVLHTGCIAALLGLLIMGRVPPEQSLTTWAHQTDLLTAGAAFFSTVISVSFISLGLTSVSMGLPLASLQALLFTFVWAGIIVIIGSLALHGARHRYENLHRGTDDTTHTVTPGDERDSIAG